MITLSIGINDFMDEVDNSSLEDDEKLKDKIDKISIRFEELLILIKKYAKNKIIVIGYYNPFPYLDMYKSNMDESIQYFNKKYEEICIRNNVDFVDIFSLFDGRIDYLPNPLSMNPNSFGYNKIFEKVKEYIDI